MRMIAGAKGFASLAFRTTCLRSGRIASCPAMPPPLMTPEELFALFNELRDRAPDIYASGGLFRRRGGSAARQPAGGTLQEPFPQGQEGRVLAGPHARRAPDRPQEVGGAADGAAVFLWRRRRPPSASGSAAGERHAFRPSQRCPASRYACSRRRDAATRPAELSPAGKQSH